MNRAEELRSRMTLPVIAAPMFLVSGVELVAACCKEGILGTFPSLNGRSAEAFDQIIVSIRTTLDLHAQAHPEAVIAPYGVNLVVHKTNKRLDEDLDVCVRHKTPLIITSLGKPDAVAEVVHGYGGLVFSDVITVEYARKAIASGVDGLILVCAGAGGHAGTLNPFTFVAAVREFFDGIIAVSGCISDGRAVRACEALGADFAYMGTRFIPTFECAATEAYKEMLVEAEAADILYTSAVSGVNANFIRQSLVRCGYDIEAQGKVKPHIDLEHEYTLWRDIWTAGQGVQTIHAITSIKALADRLKTEYAAAGAARSIPC